MQDDVKQFWTWFSANEQRLFDEEPVTDVIMDELSAALSRYEEGLVFEVTPPHEGSRDFIVSADGVGDLFPAVIRLVRGAPGLERWRIVAFRPRMDDYSRYVLEYADRSFDPSEIWTYHRIEDGHFDLIMYYPGYDDEDRDVFVAGGYILLDMALGEYDVTTKIRHIDHQLVPPDPQAEGLSPFSELRAQFDAYQNVVQH